MIISSMKLLSDPLYFSELEELVEYDTNGVEMFLDVYDIENTGNHIGLFRVRSLDFHVSDDSDALYTLLVEVEREFPYEQSVFRYESPIKKYKLQKNKKNDC